MTGVKMITCCYCGARDMVRMGKGERIALSCLTCGAPVRKVETVKPADPPPPAKPPEKVNKHRKLKHFEAALKRKKKRKSLLSRLIDEAEDLFDFDDLLDFD